MNRWRSSKVKMAALLQPCPLTFRAKWRPIRCANEREILFSRIAPVYDQLNDLLSLGQHRIWKRMAVSWSGAKVGDRVLDVCCGSGDLAFLLSQKVGSSGKVIGLDISKEQLSVASSRQHLPEKGCYENIEWIEGDAQDLPFPDGYFDAITMGYGLRNVVDKHKAMREILRVIKQGSQVSILDFNRSTQPLTSLIQDLMIDNIVVPVANVYGLAEEYEYLKSSIREFLTGLGRVPGAAEYGPLRFSLPVSIIIGKELENLALEAGFSAAKHYEVSGGLMGNLVARR